MEHANEETVDRIERALEPPVTFKVKGAPIWYGDDDDAWESFEYAMKR